MYKVLKHKSYNDDKWRNEKCKFEKVRGCYPSITPLHFDHCISRYNPLYGHYLNITIII